MYESEDGEGCCDVSPGHGVAIVIMSSWQHLPEKTPQSQTTQSFGIDEVDCL